MAPRTPPKRCAMLAARVPGFLLTGGAGAGVTGALAESCRAGTGAFPPAGPAALSGGGQPGADPVALIPLAPWPPAASPASPPLGNRGWYVGAPVGPACRCRRLGAAPGPAPALPPPGPPPPPPPTGLWPPARAEGAQLPPPCAKVTLLKQGCPPRAGIPRGEGLSHMSPSPVPQPPAMGTRGCWGRFGSTQGPGPPSPAPHW